MNKVSLNISVMLVPGIHCLNTMSTMDCLVKPDNDEEGEQYYFNTWTFGMSL